MNYYIPANKIPIQCTYDMYLYFKPVVYEVGEAISFVGDGSVGDEFCFLVVTRTWRRSFKDYDEAYDFYKKREEDIKQRNIRFYSGRFERP